MPGYSNKVKYQTKPTEEVATAEERFVVEEKPAINIDLELVYKVIVFAMLAYIVARMNKLV
jgi:RNA-splicing ligase RtcB